jgi:metal-responsive CopG/Arc/MetJ family transcriptional regulator
MPRDEESVRLNIEIPAALNKELNRLIPKGAKSEAIRSLLWTLVRELKQPKRLIVVEALLKNCASIVFNEKLLESENERGG